MDDWLPVIPMAISAFALIVSGVTAWLTLFRRGTLRMSRPNVIFFGFDSTPGKPDPKVFLRFLLYSTSAKGQLLENLYVQLQKKGESRQNFSIWVYGEKSDLSRGSGLFVGRDGVAKNHHFLLPTGHGPFAFAAGDYQFRVFGNLVNSSRSIPLFETTLSMTEEQARSLESRDNGLYFDWGPESQKYQAHVDRKETTSLEVKMLSPPLPKVSVRRQDKRPRS
jgi:hypothetical protein